MRPQEISRLPEEELLLYAASALNLSVLSYDQERAGCPLTSCPSVIWNPLRDNADAFDLQIRSKLTPIIGKGRSGVLLLEINEVWQEAHDDDAHAATRRVLVVGLVHQWLKLQEASAT